MERLRLVGKDKVIVSVLDAGILRLVCLGWFGLQTEDRADILFSLGNGHIVPLLALRGGLERAAPGVVLLGEVCFELGQGGFLEFVCIVERVGEPIVATVEAEGF